MNEPLLPVADESVATRAAASTDPTLSRVAQGAHEAIDRAAERAAPVVDKLRVGLAEATGSLQHHAEDWSALQAQWLSQARSFVREHPLAAVAGAVAIGMVLSRLTDHR